jgi:hypothetical protein
VRCATVVVVAIALAVSGCSAQTLPELALALAHETAGGALTVPAGDPLPSGESAGLDALHGCDDADVLGDTTEWVLVDGYPAEQLAAVGIVVECGDAAVNQEGGENFLSARATVTDGDLYSLGGQLTVAGYELEYDDFLTVDDPDTGFVGGRDYVSADGATVFSIEAYDLGTLPASYIAYFDFCSPETRALG